VSARTATLRPAGRQRAQGYLLLILLLAFALRVYRLDHQSMWWDEMHAGMMSVLSPDAILDNLFAIRNHVPLYFMLVRLWSCLGHSEFALRLFSVIWGVAGVALVYRLGHLINGQAVGIVSALLLALSPFHIWYSQEARMYTLASVSTLAGSWLLLRFLRHEARRDLVGYVLCMSVAVYTHYLALFVLVAHYAFFSLYYRYVRRTFVRWLAAAGIVTLLFGIWWAMMMVSGGFARSPIGWIAPARWYEPALTLLTFAAGPTVNLARPAGYLTMGALLAAVGLTVARVQRERLPRAVPAAMIAVSTVQRRTDRLLGPRFLLCWLAVPVLLTWLISLDLPISQKRSIYVDRYLITVLPPFLVLAAWGLVSLWENGRWVACAALILAVVGVVPSLLSMYRDPAYSRDNWRGAMAHLGAERQVGDVLLLRPSHTLPYAYYLDLPLPYQEFPFLFYEEEREAYLAQEIESRVASIAQEWDRAWLISSVDNTNAHGFPHERNAALARIGEKDAIKGWLDARYPRVEEVTFTGVLLTLYDLSGERQR
jgi:4-amino-4-deoxy-L-arabinose transferase-like glycosyltransferase